jgi:hypothetical protein
LTVNGKKKAEKSGHAAKARRIAAAFVRWCGRRLMAGIFVELLASGQAMWSVAQHAVPLQRQPQ